MWNTALGGNDITITTEAGTREVPDWTHLLLRTTFRMQLLKPDSGTHGPGSKAKQSPQTLTTGE